jgi:hypothetical protein
MYVCKSRRSIMLPTQPTPNHATNQPSKLEGNSTARKRKQERKEIPKYSHSTPIAHARCKQHLAAILLLALSLSSTQPRLCPHLIINLQRRNLINIIQPPSPSLLTLQPIIRPKHNMSLHQLQQTLRILLIQHTIRICRVELPI